MKISNLPYFDDFGTQSSFLIVSFKMQRSSNNISSLRFFHILQFTAISHFTLKSNSRKPKNDFLDDQINRPIHLMPSPPYFPPNQYKLCSNLAIVNFYPNNSLHRHRSKNNVYDNNSPNLRRTNQVFHARFYNR